MEVEVYHLHLRNLTNVNQRTHRKLLVIDELWVSVGSANFDNRSFRLNDEANLNVFDGEFAREESAAFERDKQQAREITWEEWKQRPLMEKVGDTAVGLLRSQVRGGRLFRLSNL